LSKKTAIFTAGEKGCSAHRGSMVNIEIVGLNPDKPSLCLIRAN